MHLLQLLRETDMPENGQGPAEKTARVPGTGQLVISGSFEGFDRAGDRLRVQEGV